MANRWIGRGWTAGVRADYADGEAAAYADLVSEVGSNVGM